MKAGERATEIGGYFGLEIGHGRACPHGRALALNTARNGLLYVLSLRKTRKFYLPCFICNSVVQTLESANAQYEFYNINEQMEMAEPFDLQVGDRVLVVNYFGLKSAYCRELSEKYGKALFVDNTQAFYAEPIAGCDTIYSPRKFLGVSDGGYLYTNETATQPLDQDVSHDAVSHLVGRIDRSAAEFYQDYLKSEKRLEARPVRRMSSLTRAILASPDYELARKTRERNFLFLHAALAGVNRMRITLDDLTGPMVYPLWTHEHELRHTLLSNRVYVASYWKEVLDRPCVSDVERDFVANLVPLPIDQRYGLSEMQVIVDLVLAGRKNQSI